MSKGAKIAIIVTLAVIAVFGSCVGGAMWWWSENKDGLIHATRAGLAEGGRFGESADNQLACIEEGMERSAGCGRMQLACGTGAQTFTQGCLYTAPASDGICEGVPGPTEVIDTVSWSTGQCKDRGQTLNDFCASVMGALQVYCDDPELDIDFAQLEGRLEGQLESQPAAAD
jgi:hypothetical protein